MEDEKLDVVRTYLDQEFDLAKIEEKEDLDDDARTFKLFGHDGHYVLKIGRDFLESNDGNSIRMGLENWEVAEVLKASKDAGIFVRNDGIERFEVDT